MNNGHKIKTNKQEMALHWLDIILPNVKYNILSKITKTQRLSHLTKLGNYTYIYACT